VDVAERRAMDVHVEQPGPAGRVAERQAGLLARLAQRRVPRRLAGLEMTARLEPDAHTLVAVQDDAARADHDGGTGHVDRARETGERAGKAVQRRQQPQPRSALAQVRWRGQGQHLLAHQFEP
jgi:hypothetical protein